MLRTLLWPWRAPPTPEELNSDAEASTSGRTSVTTTAAEKTSTSRSHSVAPSSWTGPFSSSQSQSQSQSRESWDTKRQQFSLCAPESLLDSVSDLVFLGRGGYSAVFKGQWHSATVAVKFIASRPESFQRSAGFYEALLSKELNHPNLVRTFVTRCAELTATFLARYGDGPACGPYDQAHHVEHSGGPEWHDAHGDGYESDDGFGSPCANRVSSERALTWRDILFAVGGKEGDFISVIILDFCDWGSLTRAIQKGLFKQGTRGRDDNRIRLRALLRTAREVAQALDHLHSLDVVHGDLKPANVMLKGSRSDRRGFVVQIIDYGLARMLDGNDILSGSVKGTMQYMAPEVFTGHFCKASDIYSLGICLWEMATGTVPYEGLHQGRIIMGVQAGTLRPDRAPVEACNPQLGQLFVRCITQEAKQRPSAREVIQELTRIEQRLRDEARSAAAAAAATGSTASSLGPSSLGPGAAGCVHPTALAAAAVGASQAGPAQAQVAVQQLLQLQQQQQQQQQRHGSSSRTHAAQHHASLTHLQQLQQPAQGHAARQVSPPQQLQAQQQQMLAAAAAAQQQQQAAVLAAQQQQQRRQLQQAQQQEQVQRRLAAAQTTPEALAAALHAQQLQHLSRRAQQLQLYQQPQPLQQQPQADQQLS